MISVVYPVYNVEKYIELSLQSILNQDFTDFEIIAVNDGSTDNSLEILEKLASKDARIRIYNQDNQGVARTRHNALKIAKGEYVCFVDSDDILPENSLSLLYNSLIVNDVDISEGNYCKVFPDGKVVNYEFPEEKVISTTENLDALFSGKVLHSLWAKLYKKELFDDAELKEFVFLEDFCLAVQAMVKAKKIALTSKCVYKYVQNDKSAVHSHFYDKDTTDYYYAKTWIADYVVKNLKEYKNQELLDSFVLQGFAYALCLGGGKYIKKEDYDYCRKLFKTNKKCLPIGQRVVVQTVCMLLINKALIFLYQIRISKSKR